MERTKTKRLRYYLKWALWVVIVQVVLANISASIYAYKFTHFYNQAPVNNSSRNIFEKTWKLFVGPSFYKNTSEPEPSFPYETVILKTNEGIPIDAWYSAVDSSKACVVLVHGFDTNKSFLEKEAAEFRSWGYSVILFDLRAHGKSGGNTTSLGMKETDEVQKAVTFATGRGNKKIILYGVSLGAGICIKTVSDGLVNPWAMIADMPFQTLHQHLKSRAKVLGFPSEPFASLVTMWIGIEKGYNTFKHDVAAYAKNVQCPVLVEWGERDRFVMRDEVGNVYDNLATTHKKLVIYPDADHDSYLHVDPNRWETEMKSFLNSLQP